MNAKRSIFGYFGGIWKGVLGVFLSFFSVKFGIQKSCSCKINDKYHVCNWFVCSLSFLLCGGLLCLLSLICHLLSKWEHQRLPPALSGISQERKTFGFQAYIQGITQITKKRVFATYPISWQKCAFLPNLTVLINSVGPH